MAAALVDSDGAVLRTARRPTATDDVWAACVAALREVADGEQVSAVGIGCAGPIDVRTATVSPLNIPAWRGFPLVSSVAREFRDAAVRLGGDGACMAMAEYRFGAGRGVPNLMGVVVSTGVGGGLVLDGHVVQGRSGNAGHIGHVVVEPGGAVCACGGVGCLEAVASGPSAVRWARARGWSGADAVALAADAQPEGRSRLARLPGRATVWGRRWPLPRRSLMWTWWCSAVASQQRGRRCGSRCARPWPGTPGWALPANYGWCLLRWAQSPAWWERRRWCCSCGESHRYACAVGRSSSFRYRWVIFASRRVPPLCCASPQTPTPKEP